MKFVIKTGVVLGFFLSCVLVFSTRQIEATAASGGNVEFADAASPRSLYVQNCARCHGKNGRAETREGRRVEADDLTSSDAQEISDAKLKRVITNGRGKMPGFGKRLTTAQINQIAGYVRSL